MGFIGVSKDVVHSRNIDIRNPHSGSSLDSGYAGEISKSRNFSGWQKKYKKSENDR